LTATEMQKLFEKAAQSALYSWKTTTAGVDDLVSDLWVWYLESSATQKKLAAADRNLAITLIRRAALQILAKQVLSNDRFNGKNLYSADCVRAALRGESRNRYLIDILPLAFNEMNDQNPVYAEALRSRYTDGVVPEVHSAAEKRLSRAVKSLTERVNIIVITSGVDADGKVTEGPGSRAAVFPETRKPKGHGHSDPTGNTAIMLIEHPELRDEYLEESPLAEFLRGESA